MFRPLNNDFCLTVKGKLSVVSPVPGLLTLRKPTAIRFAIRAVYVLTLQGKISAGLFAHILQEMLKQIPTLANSNPPGAVPLVVPVVRIEAPLTHVDPSKVSLRSPHAVAFIVSTSHTSHWNIVLFWLRLLGVLPMLLMVVVAGVQGFSE